MAYPRIVIADDDFATRRALHHLLEPEIGLEVVGEACDPAEAVAVAVCSRADLVILDYEMGGIDGAETTRMIRRVAPHTRVLIFSSQDSDVAIDRALRAGAAGYALKGEIHDVLQAIEAVKAGRSYLSPGLCSALRRG